MSYRPWYCCHSFWEIESTPLSNKDDSNKSIVDNIIKTIQLPSTNSCLIASIADSQSTFEPIKCFKREGLSRIQWSRMSTSCLLRESSARFFRSVTTEIYQSLISYFHDSGCSIDNSLMGHFLTVFLKEPALVFKVTACNKCFVFQKDLSYHHLLLFCIG